MIAPWYCTTPLPTHIIFCLYLAYTPIACLYSSYANNYLLSGGPGSVSHSQDHPMYDYEQRKAEQHVDRLAEAAAKRGVEIDILAGG